MTETTCSFPPYLAVWSNALLVLTTCLRSTSRSVTRVNAEGAYAQIILQAVTQQTGADSRGLTPRSDLTGFNWSEVPCILLEMGFLSNAQENEQLKQQEYRQNIAVGIANGVCQWKQSMESE